MRNLSRRWLSSCFSVPDATIRSATCGRKKTSQAAHALDFAYLVGDALFEFIELVLPAALPAVGRARRMLNLIRSIAQFV